MSASPAATPEIDPPPRPTREAADRLFDAGDCAAAEQAYDALLADGQDSGWIRFQFARCAMRRRDWAGALVRLEAALAVPRPVVWAAYERACALEELGAPPRIVAEATCEFLLLGPAKLADGHYSRLLRWAHAAFDARAQDVALTLYDFVGAAGRGGALCRLRQADLRVNAQRAEEALSLLEGMEFGADLAPWAEAVRARALIALGRDGAAETTLRGLIALRPDHPVFVRMLFGVLERTGKLGAVADATPLVAGLPADARAEFIWRAALARQDIPAIAALAGAAGPLEAASVEPLVVAAINRATDRKDFPLAARLHGALAGTPLNTPSVLAAFLSACFVQRDWARAEAALAEAPDAWFGVHAELQARRIELLCHRLRLDEAAVLADAWDREAEVLPVAATGPLAQLWAARGAWTRVIMWLADRVSHGMPVGVAPLLDAAVEAARRTGGHHLVITSLTQALAEQEHPLVRQALRGLEADRVLRALGARTPGPPAGALPRAVRRALGEDRAATRPAPVIFLCADRAYLVGAATALFSVLRHNPALAGACGFTLVASAADQSAASELCATLERVFGAKIDLVPAETLRAPPGLRTSWGLFTPGQEMGQAAYWRLFMAAHLARRGASGRALYLDADVLAGPGIARLLAAPLAGQPLGARVEAPIPEIVEAAARIGVAAAEYVNSGVLLFDLGHAATLPCLEASLAAARDAADRLTFHDQCALNIGFAGRIRKLPSSFNRFIRPRAPEAASARPTIVAHYMGRPKPWDPFYTGAQRGAWRNEFALLAECCPPGLAATLLAQAGDVAPQPLSVVERPECHDPARRVA